MYFIEDKNLVMVLDHLLHTTAIMVVLDVNKASPLVLNCYSCWMWTDETDQDVLESNAAE